MNHGLPWLLAIPFAVGFDWNVNAGQVLIIASLCAIAMFAYRFLPGGTQAVETWKTLAEGRKEELDEVRVDAKRRFEEVEAEKARAHDLEIRLAKCQEQPKTEELAAAVKRLADSFDAAAAASSREFTAHRGELTKIMGRIADAQVRDQETLGSMYQALLVLVDRNRNNRAADAEGRDPPLST